MKTAVSYLGSKDVEQTIEKINRSKANYIHIDVADGLFVNNCTPYTKDILEQLKNSKKKKDVHLMTLHLKKFIDVFASIDPKYITFHYEATLDILEYINYIKTKKCKAGLAINPFTPIEKIIPFIHQVDLVLLMSVVPGYGSQKFINESVERLNKLCSLRKKYKAKFKISIDGGIKKETVLCLKKNKPDILISGSYIWKYENYNKQLNILLDPVR